MTTPYNVYTNRPATSTSTSTGTPIPTPSSSPSSSSSHLPTMAKSATVTLQSQEHRDLLDIIDRLRGHGMSHYIDLPEIIVCGDQSAGKSSVLEAISGMSFPAKDNVCTRFATEVVLRRNTATGVKVTIMPGPDRTPAEREALSHFSPPSIDIDEEDGSGGAGLTDVIDKAREAMGLGAPGAKGFSADVLKVEISGPTQPNLTMVDLPGLFRASNKDQKASDAPMVKSMVQECMRRPRSIILAVVSAHNDFNLQEVTEMAHELDPQGLRTLGLITKPDTLDAGSDKEATYVRLAENRDVELKLGWHVVKNRSYSERDCSNAERNAIEERFFKKGVWAKVNPNILGVVSLRSRLSNVLKDQILGNIGNLTRDVREGIEEVSNRLASLGVQRTTLSEQRRYLCQFADEFTSLIKASEEGDYHDPFFDDNGTVSKKVRAVIRQELDDFTRLIYKNGEAQVIEDDSDSEDNEDSNGGILRAAPYQEDSSDSDESCKEDSDDGDDDGIPTDPDRSIPRQEYLKEVDLILLKDRGRELPGLFNPMVITLLFRRQCRPWREIAERALDRILDMTHAIVLAMVQHKAVPETADMLASVVSERYQELRTAVAEKLDELLDQHLHGHPITCNQGLVDTVHETHMKRHRKSIKKLLHLYNPKIGIKQGVEHFVAGLKKDLGSFGSSIALDYMQAYYKIAIENFIDAFCILAIERCVLKKLPLIFPPTFVAGLEDHEINRLSAETSSTISERKRCESKLKILEKGMEDLRRLGRN